MNPPTPAAGASKLTRWLATHKPEAALGVGGIGVTIFLALRARKQAAASGSSTSSGTSASQALPVSYYPPASGGDSFDAGQFGGVLSQLSQELNTLAGQPPAPSTSPVAAPAPAAAAAAPAQPGFGEVPTSLGEMVWLGVTGAGGSTSSDYQVGGGAPVYFGNTGSLAQGGVSTAGVDVYTPAAYSGQVSKAPGA